SEAVLIERADSQPSSANSSSKVFTASDCSMCRLAKSLWFRLVLRRERAQNTGYSGVSLALCANSRRRENSWPRQPRMLVQIDAIQVGSTPRPDE
ncbi:hypothetical protein, partial [Mycobacterium asiaticum]|uniref:hypothetical protein n=1 Tax=Mycobacterium asiaticum TaxID=1790 RepID=UPI001C12B674